MERPNWQIVSREDNEAPRGRREAGDDFFCLRFAVWYPSIDCAYRTRYQTCPACADCDQGRFNHKRHATMLDTSRLRRPSFG